jgi:methionyl aminopeptidase
VLGRDRIEYKTAEQILLMRGAGLVVADALDAVRDAIAPGVTTLELDRIAEQVIRGAGAVPSFLGYGHPPVPRVDLHLGERRDRARHPRRPRPGTG